MSSLDVLHYVLSVAIIIIALVAIGVGVAFILFIQEAKKALQLLKHVVRDMGHLGESMQKGIIGNAITVGKSLFRKKNPHE